MALYSRADYEADLRVLERCSAEVNRLLLGEQEYANWEGLTTFARDYTGRLTDIAVRMRRKRDGEEDLTRVWEAADTFRPLLAGRRITGFEARRIGAGLESIRVRLQGKLLGTRLILQDRDSAGRCRAPELHTRGCKCANLRRGGDGLAT